MRLSWRERALDDVENLRDYRIIYEIMNGELYIVTVIHGSRRLDL